jgi:thiamine biosynthesis protein ThiI
MADQEMLLVASSETTLKSSPVRNLLERRVMKHLRIILSRHGEKPSITRKHGRIVVMNIVDMSGSAVLASKVFGVASVMQAIQTTMDMNTIVDQAVELGLGKIKPDSTFAVKARRLGVHSFTSKDLENMIGSKILEVSAGRGVRVDLKKPETTIYVEVKEDCTYVFTERIEGPGGLPYGCQGSVLSLFSESLNSRLSTWLLMKRGARIIPLYCDGESLDRGTSRENVLRWLRQIYSTLPVRKSTLIIVPFKDVLKRLEDAQRPDLVPILKMHAMLMIAGSVVKEMSALGIVTGETLTDLAYDIERFVQVSSGVNTPIYRPVIGLEKDEIKELAKRASLYDESCAYYGSGIQVLSAKITFGVIHDIESSLGMSSILETALAMREIVPIVPQEQSEELQESQGEYGSRLVQ